jgi:RHH-type rel operon transcriptional repressor/antitoxin RelB
MPIFVRLPDDIEKRLAALALETGRSKDFFIREAVTEYIDDLEDIYLSEKIIERVRRGEERTFDITTQEEIRQALESLSYRNRKDEK